ncbi:hypothetical protein L3Q67_40260 [Saccharothrix sp. AJ9571]|nr:hypothetical protein L3Q67_40260 [Saccharothrix sp. AJ9571]
MSFPEFNRKQRQHDQDIEALYNLATETNKRVDVIDTKVSSMLKTQGDHGSQLRDVQATLQAHTEILATHETRFDRIDAQLGGMDARLGGMDARLGGMDAQLGGMDARLGGMDAQLGGMDARLDGQSGQLDQIIELLREQQRPETD